MTHWLPNLLDRNPEVIKLKIKKAEGRTMCMTSIASKSWQRRIHETVVGNSSIKE